jgi:hypothetical protein
LAGLAARRADRLAPASYLLNAERRLLARPPKRAGIEAVMRPRQEKPKPKRRTKPISWEDSPWIRLQKETTQDYELRRPIITEIQNETNCQVYVFFTSFIAGDGICDNDVEMLENVLSVEHQGGPLLLIINSPGGQALAAERVVNVCRAYSSNKFSALVPHMAKSAATLICFGADKIYMSKTAELGPVDPQVSYVDDQGNHHWTSAAEYIRAYDNLMRKGTSGRIKRLEPVLLQLARFDARRIEQLRSHQALSEDISIRLLKGGMMRRVSKREIKKRIGPFLVQKEKSSHGRMINYDEAKACKLNVGLIDLNSTLWELVWHLYVRCDWVMKNRRTGLIETASTSVHKGEIR